MTEFFPIVVLLSLVLAVVTRGADICEKNSWDVCHKSIDLFLDFPSNTEELEQKCSEQKEHLECLIDYQENCKTDFSDLGILNSALTTLRKFCNKTSVLFTAVADNGKCFKKFYKTILEGRLDKCLEKIQNMNERKYQEVMYLSNDVDDREMRMCFLGLIQTSCLADELFKDCGKTAKELLLHVLEEINLSNLFCENNQDKAKDFIKTLNLNLDPESSLENFISSLENDIEMQ